MNKTNFLIDAGAFLAFLAAMEPRFSGVPVHEWLSLALAGTVVVHLLLHWKWIIAVGGQFFRKLWHASRLKFAVDLLFFISFVSIIVSGLMISRAVLPALGISLGQGMAWRALHSTAADAGILLLGLHFALNWGWVWARLKQYLFAPAARLFRRPQPQPQPAAAALAEH